MSRGPRIDYDPRAPTERHIEVLSLLQDGLTNREIAKVLFVSEDTVKTHLKRLFERLEAFDRVTAVVEGMRRGLIPCPVPEHRGGDGEAPVTRKEVPPSLPPPTRRPSPRVLPAATPVKWGSAADVVTTGGSSPDRSD
jgi:DNA-binding CsgD family transcriptional regulator